MEKIKNLIICSFVLLSVCNGLYISDDGSQTETAEAIGTGTDPASSPEKVQQTVNSLLLPGPAIFEKVDENQFPDLDKPAENAVEGPAAAQDDLVPDQSNVSAALGGSLASGTVPSALNNVAPVPGNEASVPSIVSSDSVASAPTNVVPIPSDEASAPGNVPSGTVVSAPSDMAPVAGNEALAPNEIAAAQDEMASVLSKADSGNVASALSNDQQNTKADEPVESNTGVSLKDGKESEKIEPEEHQNDNHESLEEKGMVDMTGNESWWNNGDVEQSNDKMKSGEKTTQIDRNEEKVLDENTEESSKNDDYNFEDNDDWWTENDYDDDAELLEEGKDKDDGEGGWVKEEQNDYDDDVDDDVDNDDVNVDDDRWWDEDEGGDVDDDKNWFEDYTLADNDNDDSEDVEDWPKHGDYDNYEDTNSKEILDKISDTTTEQAWFSTTTDDYDYSSEEDDYSSEEDDYGSEDDDYGSEDDDYGSEDDDYGSEDDEFQDDDEESIQAGKELIESAHSFDNSYGAFAGAKVSSKASLQDGSFYTWTLLLTICLVLVGLFIFWNRHKVERYIVSLRHPKPNGKNVGRRKDEEENLLENEYA